MNDKSKKLPRTTDTMPPRGKVTEVCKEWLVHEDGALAYRLQKQEVEEHYTGNKTRNAQVREDLPRAKEEQQREERDAFVRYQEKLQHQAEQDEYLAMKVAENLEREEERQRRRREMRDEEIARRLQGRDSVSRPLPKEPEDVISQMSGLDLSSLLSLSLLFQPGHSASH
uniref:Coiled-coil domain-containing protein 50 n=1 Tax=Cacopsylla melanoneura TaxID=428564 RepID=A0A8D9EWG8_9HEMI